MARESWKYRKPCCRSMNSAFGQARWRALTPDGGLPTFPTTLSPGDGFIAPATGSSPRQRVHLKENTGMAGAAREVSDANFEKEVLQSSEPVLVDFFAEWCGPCKAMAPALEQVATELAGKIKVAKLDVDQNPDVTQKYRIQAMPTLMIFKNGEVAAQRVGALVQKKQLTDWINGAI